MELSSYGIISETYFSYNQKYEYFYLIKEYRRGKINAVLFKLSFFEIYKKNLKVLDMLKKYSKLNELDSLTDQIFYHCNTLLFDSDHEKIYGIIEKQF
jgi:hypothetical protein